LSDDLSGRAMSVQDEKKLCVNFISSLKNICCDAQFLITETKKENIVGLHWVGLENNGGANVAFLNRGTRGYFYERDRGMLRNVLAWGPESWIYASDNSITRGRSRYTALKGRQTFEYAILPYKTRLEAQKAALDFQLPLTAQATCAKKGSLPSSKSFLAVEPHQIIITSIFVRNGKIYARLWNASEEAARAILHVDGGARLWAVDFNLEHEEALSDFHVPMRPWGIQTVRIAPDGNRGGMG
ncbi:MAG: hypothetical protein K6T59_07365, partial [Bryobacteraceae bacterium]|nr:hypothetical protein [Bryobacteraceae bacterium]